MTKSVHALLVLAPLFAIPATAHAQDVMQCKPGTFHASSKNEDQEPLNIKGREGAVRYTLTGDVTITCNDIMVAADEMESVSDEPTVIARGHVVFKETGVSITADRAVIDRTTHLGTFFIVSGTLRIRESPAKGDMFGGLEPDAYFSGESLEKKGPKTYVLTKGVLTTCTQPTPRWYMSFSGTITVGEHVLMHNMVIRAKDVPLLYLPAFYYPITQNGRNTGFLMPTYGSSTYTGFTLSNAFFLVLGRSADATFFHDYFKKTGMGFSGEYRYAGTAGGGNASLEVLNQKAQLDTDNSTVISPAERNYTFKASISQALPHGLRFSTNDFYFTSAEAQQQYQQNISDFSDRRSRLSAQLRGSHGHYRFGVRMDFTDIYTGTSAQRNGNLPLVDFSAADWYIAHSQVHFGFSGTTGYLVRQDNLADPTTVHSLWRTDASPTIQAPIGTLSFLQVNTSASWQFTSWSQSTSPTDPNHTNLPVPITRQLFTTQVTIVGPILSRIFTLRTAGEAEKLKHVVKPYFNLGWSSPFSDSGRVVQLDGIDGETGGTVLMSYGVRTQLLEKRGTTNTREILSGSISQSYYTNLLAAAYGQQDSSTGLYNAPATSPFTPLTVAVTGRPLDYARMDFTTRYDVHFHSLREFQVSGGWSRPLVQVTAGWNKRLLVPGLQNYDTPDSTSNYLNASATLTHPNKHLGASYVANLDIKNTTFLNQRYIVYYNSQCCGISFNYQTIGSIGGLPADRRFAFSFTLAGLGSFSNPFGSFGGS